MYKTFFSDFIRLLFIRCSLFAFCLTGLFLADIAAATDYIRYVDHGLSDKHPSSATPDCDNYSPSVGNCNSGSEKAYRTLKDVNKFLDTLDSDDSAIIYFKRGDIWNLTNNTGIDINASNVTIDAFGIGDKPIIDGVKTYPDKKTNFAITIGRNSGKTVTNVRIKNIRIQNTHDTVSKSEGGGGIIFSGTSGGGYFVGPGSVENCEFENLGWCAISLYRIPNSSGSSKAIKIERTILNLLSIRVLL